MQFLTVVSEKLKLIGKVHTYGRANNLLNFNTSLFINRFHVRLIVTRAFNVFMKLKIVIYNCVWSLAIRMYERDIVKTLVLTFM